MSRFIRYKHKEDDYFKALNIEPIKSYEQALQEAAETIDSMKKGDFNTPGFRRIISAIHSNLDYLYSQIPIALYHVLNMTQERRSKTTERLEKFVKSVMREVLKQIEKRKEEEKDLSELELYAPIIDLFMIGAVEFTPSRTVEETQKLLKDLKLDKLVADMENQKEPVKAEVKVIPASDLPEELKKQLEEALSQELSKPKKSKKKLH